MQLLVDNCYLLALLFLPLPVYSDMNTHNIGQIKLNTRDRSLQHLTSVQENDKLCTSGWSRLTFYMICCDAYVYIANHVLPRTLRHTLKMARTQPRNRSSSSTLRQLRQHESPFLVIISRSTGIVWHIQALIFRTAHCNTDWNWSPEKKRCVSKYSIKEQAQKVCIKVFH